MNTLARCRLTVGKYKLGPFLRIFFNLKFLMNIIIYE